MYARAKDKHLSLSCQENDPNNGQGDYKIAQRSKRISSVAKLGTLLWEFIQRKSITLHFETIYSYYNNLTKPYQQMKIHLGKEIRQRLDENKKTVVWFSRQLNCSRTNVYKIFEKEHLDTGLLACISTILERDFFALLSEDYRSSN